MASSYHSTKLHCQAALLNREGLMDRPTAADSSPYICSAV
jgi:hypothetical protein